MREVFIVSDNIISPLGNTTEDNFRQITQNKSGISNFEKPGFVSSSFFASLLSKDQYEQLNHNIPASAKYTKFEKMVIQSVSGALKATTIDIKSTETVIVLSTTKGNISLLEEGQNTCETNRRIALHTSAKLVNDYFSNTNIPVVVSNACISGLSAILIAKRLIQSGTYKHAVVVGADVISKFILSGFQSFQAISESPCRPFDIKRNGITLGEAAGTIILSGEKEHSLQTIQVASGAVSNDANHISGPSRSGEELSIAIKKSLSEAKLNPSDIGFVSAHGTATIYNDEMEAKAFSLANLERVPVNSLKGYYGHTLGAAGIIESVISVQSLKKQVVLPTMGFQQSGVSKDINICSTIQPIKSNHFLKTASGFGGCNAALVFKQSYA